MSEPKLKTCPFCNGTAKFNVQPYKLSLKIEHKGWCPIFSKDELIFGCYSFPITQEAYQPIIKDHKEKLAEQWNRRDGE